MTEPSHVASRNASETQDADFVQWFTSHFGWIKEYLSTPTVRELMKSVGSRHGGLLLLLSGIS
jgi:hypothetical protein